MGRITKIEEKLASLVEKPFFNRNAFDPLSIEIAIKRQIEKGRKNILGAIIIPNAVSVIIDETVYRECEPFLDTFIKMLLKSLQKWIKEKGYETAHEFSIQFKRSSLKQSSFDVIARYEQVDSNFTTSLPPPFNPPCSSLDQEDKGGLSGPSYEKMPVIGTMIILKTGQQFAINEGETIIGRSKDCDITISDPTVSELHAYIYTMHGKVIIEDLGSRNGTRVNHEKVSKKILEDGDGIIIGCTGLVFRNR
jgi:hypothetical protein